MSTSMSISQFLALQVSGLQGVRVGSGQGDRISGVLDQHPDLAVGAVVGVAVGDARASGTLARSHASPSPGRPESVALGPPNSTNKPDEFAIHSMKEKQR
jgi:hypothetical protein